VAVGDTAAPSLQAAVSSSFAFGGTNAVLAFTRA
jgi:3-oxoacyl-[acyl-carrier-protein] synthase II